MATGRDSDKFMLRLPDGMRERIKAAADRHNRSMNAEIVATLEEAYPALVDEQRTTLIEICRIAAKHPEDPDMVALLSEIEAILAQPGLVIAEDQVRSIIIQSLRLLDQAQARMRFDRDGNRVE